MVVSDKNERVKTLLKETITLLCKNGLHYDSQFSVEALIGITVDESEIFLVNINETICDGAHPSNSKSGSENTNSSSLQDAPENRSDQSCSLEGGIGQHNRGDSHASVTQQTPDSSRKRKARRSPDRLSSKANRQSDSASWKSPNNPPVMRQDLPDGSSYMITTDADAMRTLSYDVHGIADQTPEMESVDPAEDEPVKIKEEVLSDTEPDFTLQMTAETKAGESPWMQPDQASVQQNQPPGELISLGLQPLGPSSQQQARQLEGKRLCHSLAHPQFVYGLQNKSGVKMRCKYCDKAFVSNAGLKIHENKHEGIYPYTCGICDKGFMITGQLRSHCKLEHDNRMPFECKICGKGYFYKNELNVHEATECRSSTEDINSPIIQPETAELSPCGNLPV